MGDPKTLYLRPISASKKNIFTIWHSVGSGYTIIVEEGITWNVYLQKHKMNDKVQPNLLHTL